LKKQEVRNELEIVRCLDCGVWFSKNFPEEEQLEKFYNTSDYYQFWGGLSRENIKRVEKIKKKTFKWTLDLIESYKKRGRILDVGCATGVLLKVAKLKGWEVYGVECFAKFANIAKKRLGKNIYHGMFEKVRFRDNFFEIILFYDSLEHMSNPQKVIKKVFEILKPGGYVVIVTPNTKSFSAKIMGKSWTHFKAEHLFYFSPQSIKKILEENGLQTIHIGNTLKALSVSYMNSQFQSFPTPVLTPLFRFLVGHLPSTLTFKPFYLPTGEMFVIAKKPN
jgi:2-polyprenyl-3-methyl-5-hydroxy-6-metoxy-1,4-benzoquinol methylase